MRNALLQSCKLNVDNGTCEIETVALGDGTHRQEHTAGKTDTQQTDRGKLVAFARVGAIDSDHVVVRLV